MLTSSEQKNALLPLYDSITDYNERVYDIIESYFNNHHTERLVRHQLESYNDFVQIQIEKTIQMFNPMHIRSENDFVAEKGQYFLEIIVHFDNFKMHPPVINENNGSVKKLLPQEAKIRNITYASNMSLDMNIQYVIRNTVNMDEPKIISKKIPGVSIGKMPVMVKSAICYLNTHSFPTPLQNTGECNMDCGGYFIIKGSEKTVLGQERTAENKIYCFDGKNTAKWSWMAEYKSIPDYKCISPKQVEMMVHNKTNGIYIQIPRIKVPIELFTLYRAYGIMSDKAICEYIVYDVDAEKNRQILEFLLASITDGTKYMTQDAALQHIISNVAYTPLNMDRETGQRKKREFTQDVLKNDVFPHCSTIPQKLFLVGLMANKLIKTRFGWIPQDDRDSYLNKRIELTGTLLNNLFRNYYNKLLKEMQKLIVREINTSSWRSSHDYENILHLNNIYKMIKPATIENGINRALATGDFSIKQMNSSKVGVAQVLNRLTYPATLSHMRRINTPLDKSGELIPPRRLHTTTWGYLCLTGETEVLSANRMDMRKICDMVNGQSVATVNRVSLEEEPSAIYRHFGKMAEKLFEITTVSGRKIKATPEHPLLVRVATAGTTRYEMKKVGELKPSDQVVIRHMVQSFPNKGIQHALLEKEDIPSPYSLTVPFKVNLGVIARIMGALFADGNLSYFVDKQLHANFRVESEMDAKQLAEDIRSLGLPDFDKIEISEIRGKLDINGGRWSVQQDGLFPHLLAEAFGYGNAFGHDEIPGWILEDATDNSVKREFLSGYQGIEGSKLYFDELKPHIGHTYCRTEQFSKDLVIAFQDLGIRCEYKQRDYQPRHYVRFDNSLDNLAKYADTIYYAYSENKRQKSAHVIEHIKIKQAGLVKNTRLMITDAENGCVCVPVFSVKEIPPEMVYDFTTESENHSFLASSFVSSNCPIETPEGQSVGVVKNISYLTHITIPCNSSALYEYVKPFITPLEKFDILSGEAEVLPKKHILDKTKVVVNGCWLGITDEPLALYYDLKSKKHAGIINIYTSVVFHYVLNEIQVCCDGGRLVRPLLRVDGHNHLLLNDDILKKIGDRKLEWNQLFLNSPEVGGQAVMEYIDPEEQAFAMIAMKTKKGDTMNVKAHKYTHAEIHPSTIMGILASCIPFPDHNQAPRNTYQCLDINETVWMADGRRVPIKEVKVGDRVLTFHPETLEISETGVVGQFVRPNEFPIYKITTVSGREIVATEDHRFMTQYGWKTVKEMIENKNIKIGINTQSHNGIVIGTDKAILTEEQYNKNLRKYDVVLTNRKHSKIFNYCEELKKIKMIPLTQNNKNLLALARIIGFMYADGSINVYRKGTTGIVFQCSFDFGSLMDAQTFQNDVLKCGFKTVKIIEGSRTFSVKSRTQTHHTFTCVYNGVLPAFLMALGVSYGKKTETQRNPLPEWIINNMEFGREFIKGFHGGDGCKVRWNKITSGYNFVCAKTSQQINPIYQESLKTFMQQCVFLLKQSNIIVKDISTIKVNDTRVEVAYKICDSHENLINYYENFGFAYCSAKNTATFRIIEYLKSKKIFAEKHIKNIETVRQIYDGLNPEEKNAVYSNLIKKELQMQGIDNISQSVIRDTVRNYRLKRQIKTPNLKDFNIEMWINEETILKNNTLFVPIQSITEEPNGLISCIETESENHSFFAGTGGFLSANCAMQKQAMGIYATNYDKRMDKTGYILTYPMRPLVDTRLMNFIHINRVPSGCQIYVAIMTHTGYNQEDSVLINQGAVDRGLFVTTIFHTEKDEDKSVVRDEIIRCKPDKTKTRGMKFGNYEKLNNKGFIPENTLVENRDVIIAKITPIKENRNDPSKTIKYEDQSKVFRTTEETYVDRNITGRNGDGYNFAKTRTRIFRKPVIGDKFACALPTQQVLTDAGWIEFRSLDITKHRVATLSATGELLYEFPKEKFVYDYNGPLVEMSSQVQMICTPNHNLYVQPKTTTTVSETPCWETDYEFKKAEDVKKNLETGQWKGAEFQQVMFNGLPDVQFVPGTQDKVLMDEWLPLLGQYFNTTRSSISKEEKYRSLYMAIKLKQNVLPKYVWRLSQRQCRILMDHLLENPNRSSASGTRLYMTTSQSLADDVMRLATHAGGTGRIQLQLPMTGSQRDLLQQAGYVVIVTATKPPIPAIVQKGDIRFIQYTGQVYCVEMPTSHLYYFRETPYSSAFLSGNSRSSQKGTLGNLIPEQDMPFTKNGLRPDLILNPHAIPSRMTIAQLKETLLGKVLVELGMFGDGTAFNEDLTVPNISAELQKLGYESYGNEIMYDGTTGKQMEVSVFMGPVFYQRLKHMVNDKQHSRAIGPMVNLTRQPAEGRCRDGGFRIGEMERDVMIAHGMSEFCKDRLMDASDKYSMHVCKMCGMVAGYNDGKMKKPECLEGMVVHLCNTCQNRTEFARIEVPYTYKLLSQELQTINIVPRYITE